MTRTVTTVVTCHFCRDGKQFARSELYAHQRDAHGINPKRGPGIRVGRNSGDKFNPSRPA